MVISLFPQDPWSSTVKKEEAEMWSFSLATWIWIWTLL